jgi:hypothetical protein
MGWVISEILKPNLWEEEKELSDIDFYEEEIDLNQSVF